jgi:hydrogenase nickel incorporation protein HypB
MSVITIERKVLEKNDEIAHRNRESFQKLGILVLNLVSSPGAGKTSIIFFPINRNTSAFATIQIRSFPELYYRRVGLFKKSATVLSLFEAAYILIRALLIAGAKSISMYGFSGCANYVFYFPIFARGIRTPHFLSNPLF